MSRLWDSNLFWNIELGKCNAILEFFLNFAVPDAANQIALI